jgi:hypothetical protein
MAGKALLDNVCYHCCCNDCAVDRISSLAHSQNDCLDHRDHMRLRIVEGEWVTDLECEHCRGRAVAWRLSFWAVAVRPGWSPEAAAVRLCRPQQFAAHVHDLGKQAWPVQETGGLNGNDK